MNYVRYIDENRLNIANDERESRFKRWQREREITGKLRHKSKRKGIR